MTTSAKKILKVTLISLGALALLCLIVCDPRPHYGPTSAIVINWCDSDIHLVFEECPDKSELFTVDVKRDEECRLPYIQVLNIRSALIRGTLCYTWLEQESDKEMGSQAASREAQGPLSVPVLTLVVHNGGIKEFRTRKQEDAQVQD